MLPAKRRQYIMEELYTNQNVVVADLAEQMQVTPMTIRRDIELLEQSGLLEKTHGGAVLAESSLKEVTYRQRKTVCYEEKSAIAKAAAKLVKRGMCIYLDAGTTNYALARILARQNHTLLTIVTNDLAIAQALMNVSNYKVIVLGGMVDPASESVCGIHAANMAAAFHYDICFVGTQAITPEWQVMTVNADKILLKQNYLKAASLKVLLADSTKFGKYKIYNICSALDFDMIISGKIFESTQLQALTDGGVKVVKV